MLDVSREDIVDGTLSRALLLLAAPLVAQNFALVGQQVIDLFWVGRVGEEAVAAVGVATVIIGLLFVPIMAFTIGTQIITSQRVGADALSAARRTPFNAAAASVLVAGFLGILIVLYAKPVVELFDITGQTAVFTVSYLTAYSLALVTTAASDTIEMGFTGWGDSRAALYINLVAIAINLILDPLLILGIGPFPELEVFGAALATAIGYGCGAVFAITLAYRGRNGFKLTRDALTPDLSTVREVVNVGVPVAIQNSGRHLARLVIVAVLATVAGAAALTAYYLGWQVATIAFVPARGLGQASTSVVGQNLGAEQPDRARRATWFGVGIAVVGLSVFGVVQWLFPELIASVFIPDISGAALAHSIDYLVILAYGYWALGAIYTVEAGFNGASKTKVSMVSTLLQYWAVRVPIAVIGALVFNMGALAVFWAVTLSNIAAALGLAIYYYYSTSRGMLRGAAKEAAETTSGD